MLAERETEGHHLAPSRCPSAGAFSSDTASVIQHIENILWENQTEFTFMLIRWNWSQLMVFITVTRPWGILLKEYDWMRQLLFMDSLFSKLASNRHVLAIFVWSLPHFTLTFSSQQLWLLADGGSLAYPALIFQFSV